MNAAVLTSSKQLQTCGSFASSSAGPRRLAAAPRRQAAVRTQAAVKAPQGVTQPPAKPVSLPSSVGFVENAERLNSRAAMIGFFALLAVEAIANKGLLDLIGVTTGKGLGFEF